MARFIAQSRHTNEECLKTLDEFAAQGPNGLPRWDFGCAVGEHSNHIAYAVLEAATEAEARAAIPAGVRREASLTEVGKFTSEQVRSFHQ